MASQWYYQFEKNRGNTPTWPEFVGSINKLFGLPVHNIALGLMVPVEEYQDLFLKLLARCEGVSERQQIDIFTVASATPRARTSRCSGWTHWRTLWLWPAPLNTACSWMSTSSVLAHGRLPRHQRDLLSPCRPSPRRSRSPRPLRWLVPPTSFQPRRVDGSCACPRRDGMALPRRTLLQLFGEILLGIPQGVHQERHLLPGD